MLVGFARRFAAYKRAALLFEDPARLRAILDRPDRPVRILFAGKAHPADGEAHEVLARVAQFATSDEFAGRVFLLEDHDLDLARRLVQGCDVWLNTPVRSQEASGTSGMKSAANGGLTLSVADGWWIEGFDGTNGWEIDGADAEEDGAPATDEQDAARLYQLLEDDVVPLFFDRDERGTPVAWCRRVARSLATIPGVFDTDRMLAQYRDRAYAPMVRRGHDLVADDCAAARREARERSRVRRGFAGVRFLAVRVDRAPELRVGDELRADVELDLASLAPQDVEVELIVRGAGNVAEARVPPNVVLTCVDGARGPSRIFHGSLVLSRSGPVECGVRVRARRDALRDPDGQDMVLWA